MNTDKKHKPTICIDFDGVLHSYTSGWKGAGTVVDPPVEGALEWLVGVVFDTEPRANIAVYSSRSKYPEGVAAMKGWLTYWVEKKELLATPGALVRFLSFPTQKPAAIMTIDDRAHRFEGKFRSLDWYLNFKPWNKRHPEPNVLDHDTACNQDDKDLADQVLECLLDCLTTDRDGFFNFEPSAQKYMAEMFMEARKNAITTDD